jgi:predicted RNA binding protein YcfA (HicA-like mRNA interferase family)
MKLPRDLSGREIVEALVRGLGYRVVHQRGSPVVLETDQPSHQRLVVPDHGSLRLGTLSAIIRAVSSHKGLEKAGVVRLQHKR